MSSFKYTSSVVFLSLFQLVLLAQGRPSPEEDRLQSPSVFEALSHKKLQNRLSLFTASIQNTNSKLSNTFGISKGTRLRKIKETPHKIRYRTKFFPSRRHQPRKGFNTRSSDSYTASLLKTGLVLPGLNVGPSLSDINSTFYRWESVSPPREVDWRNVTSATVVHDQLQCSSCWAMTTSDSISIMWNLYLALEGRLASENFNETSRISLRDMSPQQVCDCSLGTCCFGGWPEWGLSYAMLEGGLTQWLNYPYLAVDAKCNSSLSRMVEAKVTGWEQVPARDTHAMKQAVSQMPVIAFLSATSQDFQNYSGGIYRGECNNELNHAVLVMGYSNDTIEGPYWIIKNSWGTQWGEKGYMRIAMTQGPGMCGITSIPSLYPVYHPMGDDPCDVFPPPCGAGTCHFEAYGGSNRFARCACPPGYVENLMGVAKCVATTPCSRNPNPCNFGECTDQNDGSYTCTCPKGTILGSRADGGQTCVSGNGFGGVRTYTAVLGDTCHSVSQSYNISMETFLQFNAYLDCNISIPEGAVVAVGDELIEYGCSKTYIVKEADTCQSIGNAYNLSLEALSSANPALNCSALLKHQLVCVSNVALQTSDAVVIACEKTYNTRNGDTCEIVMQLFGLNAPTFSWLNPGVDCTKNLPSLTLCISNQTSPAGNVNCTDWYRVQQGDTCPSIWSGANITQEIFLLYNPGIRCQAPYLQIGQQVCIGGPINRPTSGSLFPYLVQTGDSVDSLVSTFATRCPGLTGEAIIQVNSLANSADALIPGQTILVPCSSQGVGRSCGCSASSTVCGIRGISYASLCDASCNYATPVASGSCSGTCRSYCRGRTTLSPAPGAPSYCSDPCPFPQWPPPSDWSWFSSTQCSFFLKQCDIACYQLADTLYPDGGSSWTVKYNSCYSSCKYGKPC